MTDRAKKKDEEMQENVRQKIKGKGGEVEAEIQWLFHDMEKKKKGDHGNFKKREKGDYQQRKKGARRIDRRYHAETRPRRFVEKKVRGAQTAIIFPNDRQKTGGKRKEKGERVVSGRPGTHTLL